MTEAIKHKQVLSFDESVPNGNPARPGTMVPKYISELLGGVFDVDRYTPKVVTVPAPTVAPTSLTAVAMHGSGTFTAGVTYQVACTYLAWNGETGLGPVTSFTAAAGQGISVLPKAELNNNSKYAVGSYVYISDDAGVTWHRANMAFVSPALVSFGDDSVWGGSIVSWNAAGAAPPAGGTTATTKSGRTVSPPTQAPTVNTLSSIPAGTYYGAYAWVCEDGTTTALSPFSAGVTVAASEYISFAKQAEPPSGAVFVKLYLGTSATAAAMKLQKTVPLSYVITEIHTYSSGGAAHVTGAAQSTISCFQQAIDAVIEAGGGMVNVPGGLDSTKYEFKTPIILRLRNSTLAAKYGIRVQGAGHDVYGSVSISRLRYTGTTTGVEGVVSATQSLTWTDLDVADPNSRIKYGLAMCDYGVGGGSFQNWWSRSSFAANASGGIGLLVPMQGRNLTSHVASEQYFDGATFTADAWCIDMHSGQTGDIFFSNLNLYCGGNSNSANSGKFRLATGFNIRINGGGSPSGGMYNFFLTKDGGHPFGGSTGSLTIKDYHTEDQTANQTVACIHASALGADGSTVSLISNSLTANDADYYAIYSGSASQFILVGNEAVSGNIWINDINTTPAASARHAVINLGKSSITNPTDFKMTGHAGNVHYDNPMLTAMMGSLAFLNATGQQSLIGTNASGDITLDPASGVATVDGQLKVTDQAYDATTWNGSLEVPTKKAVRDKIESLGSGGALLAANNLSDLANAGTARTNLGLGTGNSPTFTALTLSSGLTVDTNTLVVDATNNRVGVGTASPSYPFVVGSDFGAGFSAVAATVSKGSGNSASMFIGATTANGIEFGWHQSLALGFVNAPGTTPFAFLQNGAVKLKINSSGNVEITGNCAITGSISKGSGTFLIDHPLDPENTNLQHGFVESPRYLLIYNGRVKLNKGKATVNIDKESGMRPGTFKALTQNADVYSLSNRSSFNRVRATEIINGSFDIMCENPSVDDEVAWVVYAERADEFIKTLEHVDRQGRMIPEFPKPNAQVELLADREEVVEADDTKPEEVKSEVVHELIGTKGYPMHGQRTGKSVPRRKLIIKTVKKGE